MTGIDHNEAGHRPAKRVKVDNESPSLRDTSSDNHPRLADLRTFDRDISPPAHTGRGKARLSKSHGDATLASQSPKELVFHRNNKDQSVTNGSDYKKSGLSEVRRKSSPFQLTRIRDLPAEANEDTIALSDILGDPMIREAWLFDYLFDIDFVVCVLLYICSHKSI
jgi:tyrosyl-DNA phosphodiesterase 1